MVDEEIITRCIRGESKAQYELYKALYSQMMSVCSRYERNKQDAVARMNEGFLKVLTHLSKRREEVPLQLWVRRIMINTIIDDHRKNKMRLTSEVITDVVEESNLEEVNSFLKSMMADEIEEMLKSLPEMSARVFNLFAIDGYSHAEIGEMFGITEGTSRWHVSLARMRLKDAIAAAAKHTMIQTR